MQQGDFISRLLFFRNKESILKKVFPLATAFSPFSPSSYFFANDELVTFSNASNRPMVAKSAKKLSAWARSLFIYPDKRIVSATLAHQTESHSGPYSAHATPSKGISS
jgi:hypothetical protein